MTPGQGQTVQIAGVDVGEITKVDLVDGRAVVTMKIRRKYTPIYKNATALLRPKTGLNDMVIELDPGSQTAGEAPDGLHRPGRPDAAQRQPRRDPRPRWTPTRATTCSCCVGAAGEGLGGQGKALSADLKRFEPTGRYMAKLNGALAVRERNIRRSIHNFRLLSQALGAKDDDLARAGRLLQRGLQGVRRPGRQPARGAAGAARRAARDEHHAGQGRPSWATCSARRSAPCGPAPAPSGRRWCRRGRSSTRRRRSSRTSCGPFARDALPVVKVLRPAARDLARRHAQADHLGQVLNYLLNELAYNPPGKEEGYLFWAAWANHAGATVFSTQDAHGPIRHGLVLASCSTLQVLAPAQRARCRSSARSARCSTRPTTNAVCPTTSQAGSAPAQPGTTDPATPRARAARARPGEEPLDAEAGSQPRPHPRHGGLRALVLRPAALPVAGLRRPDPAAAQGLPLQRRLPARPRSWPRRPTCGSPASRWARSRSINADKQTGASDATIELDTAYAPIPKDTKAILRQKTLLGETYVELTPGLPERRDGPRERPPARRRGLADRRARRDLPRLRPEDARGVPASGCSSSRSPSQGRGRDISDALGNLAPVRRGHHDAAEDPQRAATPTCRAWCATPARSSTR